MSDPRQSDPRKDALWERGLTTRRAVVGDDYVDASLARMDDFNAGLQDFITRTAWGDIWNRPGLSRRDRSVLNIGMLIALGAAFIFGGVDVSTRFITGKEGVNQILFYGFLLQIPIAAVPTAFVWVTPTLADIPWILAFALAALSAQFCMTRSFSAAEASLVSPVLYLRLPMVAAIGFVFFDEFPSVWTWIGAALLFASTYYSTYRDTVIARERRSA